MLPKKATKAVLIAAAIVSMIHSANVSGKSASSTDKFYVYYTKVDSGENFEKFSHTGKFADVVVNVAPGKLVFHRSAGKWYVERIVEVSGDGTGKRHDKHNIYSFVRIIENTAEKIVIHWRYFPKFKLGSHAQPIGGNVGFDGVVHEYFTIKPDGALTRTIRQGTKKLDDWNDPQNKTTQKLKLTAKGITNVSTTKPKTSTTDIRPVKGATVLKFEDIETEVENEEEDYDEYQPLRLAASFSFDDALKSRPRKLKDKTLERISGKYYDIEGHTKVSIPKDKAVKINRDFALEAWVAPGAYSICSWSAIVHQSKWKSIVADPYVFWNKEWGPIQLDEEITEGYFIGIDEKGHVGFFIKMGPRIEKLVSDEILELNKWSHVAVTFSDGTLRLFAATFC
jgi:hypothetical protein